MGGQITNAGQGNMPIPATELALLERAIAAEPNAAVMTGPIMVAADSSEASDAALRVAWSLVGQANAEAHVVSVLEPIYPATELAAIAPLPPDFWSAQRDAQIASVQAQVARVLPGADWPVTILEGVVGTALADCARREHARLLVLGRGRHGLARRVFSGETVLSVLRFGETPVLAVEPSLAGLPRRIVAAIDFSQYSEHAARVALSIAAPGATLYLAHVRPGIRFADPRGQRWEQAYEDALPAAFARVRDRLGLGAEVQVETTSLTGRPGAAIVELAESVRADLVAAGTHGYGFFDRLVLGSVFAELLRHAPTSVLGVPGMAVSGTGHR